MSEKEKIVDGNITWDSKKKWLKIRWVTKKGMKLPSVVEKQHTALSKKVASFTGKEDLKVQVKLGNDGKPVSVWCPDEQPPIATESAPAIAVHIPTEFHNPYNFIPAPPRKGIPSDSELTDRDPIWHSRLEPKLWTGRIYIKMTAKSPLLVPDAADTNPADTKEQEHKLYPLRLDSDGRPLIPPTSVKGMLRSAYEAVTDSRMCIFSEKEHGVPLGMRRDSHSGIDMVPVRVVRHSDGSLQAELFLGTTTINPDGSGEPVKDGKTGCATMYAAWLPEYHHGSDSVRNFPQLHHGDFLKEFTAVRQSHTKGTVFDYWRVVPDDDKTTKGERKIFTNGWVCITGRNMPRKHDERVFFNENGRSGPLLPIPEDVKKRWSQLIEDYYNANSNDMAHEATHPPALVNGHSPEEQYEYSRHITHHDRENELREGTLCYASLEKNNNNGWELRALYPVIISRGLQDASPEELLDKSLQQADTLQELSPADRVFGWVRDSSEQKKDNASAYRGNIRIGKVHCETDACLAVLNLADDTHPEGLPLAILGQPKPAQARFYVAANDKGDAQRDRKTDAGFEHGKGLRGRKVYPHQRVPDGYWNDPCTDRTQKDPLQGWYQEYHRPGNVRDSQNRSISAWVQPGTEFSLDIDVKNLSDVELGALLWLLSLPDGQYLKFGGGKPLGFGSVHLSIDWDRTALAMGTSWSAYYASLLGEAPSEGQERVKKTVGSYQEAMTQAFRSPFNVIPFIRAFVTAAEGLSGSVPTHYPRVKQSDANLSTAPSVEGEGYEWFAANEQHSKDHPLQGWALPDLISGRGLPYLEPAKNKKKQ